jgi:UDP-N-acetyl-D-mannosaminuronic acid dehydrogenase
MADVCVVGLGYVGLPTAILMANAELRVIGCDVDHRKLDRLRGGDANLPGEGLDELLQRAVSDGWLEFSNRPAPAHAYLICVPTPVAADHSPDLTLVWSAVEAVCPLLTDGALVVIESTIPPLTVAETRRRVQLARPEIAARVLLAHCPERVLPGAVLHEIVHNPRIVGGETPEATERARELYSTFTKGTIVDSNAVTAELAKLAENTYRDVNIALSNEIFAIAESLGADGARVLEMASEHPRVSYLQPGLGVGGHCIPVDPWFLVAAAPDDAGVIAAARRRNDAMPTYWLDRAMVMLADVDAPRIAVLGLSYKGDVVDLRESPSIEFIHAAQARGLDVVACEPHLDPTECLEMAERIGAEVTVDVTAAAKGADLLVIGAGHSLFAKLEPAALADSMRARRVLDARGVLLSLPWEEAGFEVDGLAR